jgi:hypothetical protein
MSAKILQSRNAGHLVFCLAFLFVLPVQLFARDVSVTVIDAELDIPLEGALIRTPDGKDWECGPEGTVVVTVPDDAPVVLRAAYPGYEAGRAVVPSDTAEVAIPLTLSGIMEGRELVIEAARPRASETVPGRSVALSGRELARTAEIGAVEDVMNSIKLLPGVGYAGTNNRMPSIRGGDPGDFLAVFDGFYVENPYHFGGSFSIFDPRMIESAQLSHGIFSARYGHTVSGILEIKAKKGDTELSTVELGLSTSAANFNLSHPINDKGSFTVMLKSTYWAPVVWAAQWLSNYIDNEQLDMVNYVSVAPYILSGAVSADYRFTPALSLSANGFLGGDGGGAEYHNPYEGDGYNGYTNMTADWINSIGFLTASVLWNPRNDMVLGFRLGAGFNRTDLNADSEYNFTVPYTQEFIDEFKDLFPGLADKTHYTVEDTRKLILGNETDTIQARVDYDWDWGNGFIFAAGLEEWYSRWLVEQNMKTVAEIAFDKTLNGKTLYYNFPVNTKTDADNHALNTSGYIVGEWTSPSGFFETELGLRVDTFTFWGRDFSVKSAPAINPRLNMDFHLVKNKGAVDSLSLTLGSGLFSSITDNITGLQKGDVDDYELEPNRSWTSLAGINLNFLGSWTLNVETYYKYLFSRAYRINWVEENLDTNPQYYFDGEGNVWGADVMLQKRGGRFFDGWLAYTFTHVRYREPAYAKSGGNKFRADGYYPSFHRFHNLNLILNFRPQHKFHIYVRYGIASGRPKLVAGEIDYYPVYVSDENYDPTTGDYIQKFKRDSYYSDDSRTTLSMPLDIKFSWFFFNKKGRTTGEFYIAVENLASLFYLSRANTTFNQYTGKEDTGSTEAVYELSIPIPSVGMKWSF